MQYLEFRQLSLGSGIPAIRVHSEHSPIALRQLCHSGYLTRRKKYDRTFSPVELIFSDYFVLPIPTSDNTIDICCATCSPKMLPPLLQQIMECIRKIAICIIFDDYLLFLPLDSWDFKQNVECCHYIVFVPFYTTSSQTPDTHPSHPTPKILHNHKKCPPLPHPTTPTERNVKIVSQSLVACGHSRERIMLQAKLWWWDEIRFWRQVIHQGRC